MPDAFGILDTLPDNDSFLPRYLTVQLLEILAETVGKTKSMEPNNPDLAKKNEKFIASFKDKELFNPLTYSIFWRDQPEKVLETFTESLDDTDKYNRAPLTLAIANEDFVLACKLIDKGATLLLEDKLVLEIALISMIQRDANIIQQILSQPGDHDISWVKEYLEYLNSYITGKPQKKPLRHHEVLNPPIRHFGQVLDTLAYFNGLPSHYGFLSPSIEILATHLQQYTQDLADAAAKPIFTAIASAYSTTNNICKYYGNLPTVGDCANTITGKIVNNINTNSKDVVVVFGGWAGNSVTFAFVNKTVIFSNLGIGGSPEAGTKIFNITNPAAITPEVIDTMLRGLGNATSPVDILALLGNIVETNPIYTIKQTFNPIDNCIFVNPRAIIQGILLVINAYNKEGKATTANLGALSTPVLEMYNSYVNSLYKYSAADLARFMRNHELLQNKRVECCALALDYINQHFKEPGALKRCIELKNALEFVGLKDFYISTIDPEARAAIQELMIHEQEATAVKVIEQENSMASSGQQSR